MPEAGQDKSLSYLSDYVAIRELSGRYVRFADEGDGEGYASLYTEDGEFVAIGGRLLKGRAAIAAYVSTVKNVIHTTTDPLVEINGDTARQTSRLVAFYRKPDGTGVRFSTTGWYTDELVRTSEGWKIRSRRVDLDSVVPAPASA
jgi:ketosteroid isomerase-like protein